MTGNEGREEPRRHGRFFLIPAGVLLGLGIGLIIGYPGSGVLIGLGLGFLASAFMNPRESSGQENGISCCRTGSQWISAIIGLFLIIVGISFVWAPVQIWPYIFGLFLIGIGLLFLAKNFRSTR
nr:hypothetical protein [uncultured Methanoregula sp.]